MLHNILLAFAQYKILTVVLIVAVILTILVWFRAIRASRRHNAEREAVLKKLKREEELRKTYSAVTPELAEKAPMPDMLHGIELCIQAQIEEAPDLTAAFLALPPEKQHLYALSFLFCEDADTLSSFFRLNGKPLTTAARDGARAAFGSDALAVIEKGYNMFDDEDETTSCTPADTASLDAAFASLDQAAIFEGIRNYIAANAAIL